MLLKAKVGDMEENTREVRSRCMRKYVVRCVHAVVGKNIFLVKLKYFQKKETSSFYCVLC